MRVLKAATQLLGERLELARSLAQRARQAARDRVDEHHRRQVSVREDIGADRDRIGGKVLHDPLVEAFEPRRQKRHVLGAGELLDHRLGQLPALRTERDHGVVHGPAVNSVERGGDDVDAQHHAGTASVRLVVDLAVPERRVIAIGEEP